MELLVGDLKFEIAILEDFLATISTGNGAMVTGKGEGLEKTTVNASSSQARAPLVASDSCHVGGNINLNLAPNILKEQTDQAHTQAKAKNKLARVPRVQKLDWAYYQKGPKKKDHKRGKSIWRATGPPKPATTVEEKPQVP